VVVVVVVVVVEEEEEARRQGMQGLQIWHQVCLGVFNR
jgi:hypothetical protein